MVSASELRAAVQRGIELDPDPLWAWTIICEQVAVGRGLSPPFSTPSGAAATRARETLADWQAPDAIDQAGGVHESLVGDRLATGTFYTPPVLVEHLLEATLDGLGGPATGSPSVLDPSCGAGDVLVPAARRLIDRSARPAVDVVRNIRGIDLDPVAVLLTRMRLWLEAPETSWAELERHVVVGDGLLVDVDPVDVVMGNPPFLNRLASRTALQRTHARQVTERIGEPMGTYTDVSALFLRRSLDLVRPGGRVALVQPVSVLAARDAAPVREAVARMGALRSLWWSPEEIFPDAKVRVCVPTVEVGSQQQEVAVQRLSSPSTCVPATSAEINREWGFLLASDTGVPQVVVPGKSGVLGDQARCTADFRDQYYGLVPHVREATPAESGRPVEGEAPLVTSGLIDPAECAWGRREVRFAKQRYAAPVVDLLSLRHDPRLSDWASSRLLPKVLVATQGRVLEAVVDVEGAWLPSVPTLTLVPHDLARLWHLLAVLLSPPVVVEAAARYAGTAMSMSAIKLSAKQVAALPLPSDSTAWDRGAELARLAQNADEESRPAALLACAAQMCAAYQVSEAVLLGWWAERAGLL